jgi:hypothetical protein
MQPMVLEAENGEIVFYCTTARSQGDVLRTIIEGIIADTIKVGVLLDVRDLGSPNLKSYRFLRGLVQDPNVFAQFEP